MGEGKGVFEGFIEACERKEYMSPFELMFSLYYHDVSQALKFSTNKFKDWYEKTKESEKARTVIIHGKVSTEHFLYDDRGYGYFTNFENARQGSPLHDLLPFLSRTLKTYPKRSEESVEWIYTYMKYFPSGTTRCCCFKATLLIRVRLSKLANNIIKGKEREERERRFSICKGSTGF